MPWSAQNSCQQQYGPKVDDVRGGKCMAGLCRTARHGHGGDEGQHNELQSNQRSRGRSDDYVEIFPLG